MIALLVLICLLLAAQLALAWTQRAKPEPASEPAPYAGKEADEGVIANVVQDAVDSVQEHLATHKAAQGHHLHRGHIGPAHGMTRADTIEKVFSEALKRLHHAGYDAPPNLRDECLARWENHVAHP